MTYDDLVLSLLADRIDFLFTHRAGAIRHLSDLLEDSEAGSGGTFADDPDLCPPTSAGAETAVRHLRETIAAMSHAEIGGGFLTAASKVRSLTGRP